MKINILTTLLILCFYNIFSQDIVETELVSKEEHHLTILNTFPDSFPEISVLFQIQDKLGHPLWDLNKEGISVFENNELCHSISLKKISEDKGIFLALVIDASGSMFTAKDLSLKDYELIVNHYNIHGKQPKWYKSPLDFAKESALKFIEEEPSNLDSFLIVPFCEHVDKSHSITSSTKELKQQILKIDIGGGTGFYDAIYHSISQLSKTNNESYIIALTDGMDNSSLKSLTQIIEYANKNKVKVYTIGFGDANQNILKQIANKTDAKFFFTKNSNNLEKVYLSIKREIKSIYELKYKSDNINYKDKTREVRFEFTADSLLLTNNIFEYNLPNKVIDYLEQKELQRIKIIQENERKQKVKLEEEEKQNKRILIGGLIFMALGAIGFKIYKTNSLKPKIQNVYPNPVTDFVNIEYSVAEQTNNIVIKLRNVMGRTIFSETLPSNTSKTELDLSQLNKGWYFTTIITENGKSETIKIYKK